MWHPSESIRHPLLGSRWPSADEAVRSRLFAPLAIGRLRLEERTWVPAMVPWRATDEGMVTDDVLRWYERFAAGRPGGLVVEATGVRDIPSGPLLRIGDDRFVPGLRELVRTVRRASGGYTRLFIQLIDFLSVKRRPEREKYLRRFLTISPRHLDALGVASPEAARDALVALSDAELDSVLEPRELEELRYGYRERVTDTHLPHVRDLPAVIPGVFARAAARAEIAGFDGVELHYAHAYTMSSFLSALNTRDDGYGGTPESRARLPLETFEAVRAAVSDRFVVGCRYLAEECIAGGNTVEDGVYFGRRFAAAGMDYLSLSRGGKFEDAKAPQVGWAVYPYTGPSGWECMPTWLADRRGPFGRNVESTARIRSAVRKAGLDTPVIVSGGIHDFAQAEGILERGDADVCGAARQSLADPDWFSKIRTGRGADIRRCTYTNYCEGLDQKHKQVTCKLWDRQDLGDVGVSMSADGKRRLIAPPYAVELEPAVDD